MRRARRAETIRAKVKEILRKVSVEEPPVPVDEIAHSLGAEVRYSPFEGDLAGILYQDANRKIIGVNSTHYQNRQRFTIAHEIGHLELHQNDLFIDKDFTMKRRDENSSLAMDIDEIEANRFAAELLMPFDFVIQDIIDKNIDIENEDMIKDLADRYRVSVQAMTFRITNLLGI